MSRREERLCYCFIDIIMFMYNILYCIFILYVVYVYVIVMICFDIFIQHVLFYPMSLFNKWLWRIVKLCFVNSCRVYWNPNRKIHYWKLFLNCVLFIGKKPKKSNEHLKNKVGFSKLRIKKTNAVVISVISK